MIGSIKNQTGITRYIVTFVKVIKPIALLLAGLIQPSTGLAQTGPQDYIYPIQFDQFQQTYSVTNPAYIGQNGPFGIDLGSQFSGNTQGEVATFFSTLSFRISGPKNGNRQHIGLSVYNDQQGPKISQTRFYGYYAISVDLNDSLTLTGGFGGGGVAYSIEPTGGPVATAGNTAIVQDAKGGIWLKGNEAYLGISLNQAFNNELTPLQRPMGRPIRLERHFNFTAGKRIPLNEQFAIKTSANLRTGPHIEGQGILHTSLIIRNSLEAGFAYQVNRAQIIPQVGLKQIELGKNHLNVKASYRVTAPWSRGLQDFRSLGLSIGYNMMNP